MLADVNHFCLVTLQQTPQNYLWLWPWTQIYSRQLSSVYKKFRAPPEHLWFFSLSKTNACGNCRLQSRFYEWSQRQQSEFYDTKLWVSYRLDQLGCYNQWKRKVPHSSFKLRKMLEELQVKGNLSPAKWPLVYQLLTVLFFLLASTVNSKMHVTGRYWDYDWINKTWIILRKLCDGLKKDVPVYFNSLGIFALFWILHSSWRRVK